MIHNGKELDDDVKSIRKINYEAFIHSCGFTNQNGTYTIYNPDNIIDVMKNKLNQLSTFGNIMLSDSCKKISTFKGGYVSYGLGMSDNFFELVFKDLNYSKEELKKIFEGYRLKKKYVNLDDSLVYLDDEGYQIYKLVNDLNITDVEADKPIAVPFFQMYKLSVFDKLIENNDVFNKFYEDFCNYHNEQNLGVEFRKILRDYQIKGFNWLSVLYKYKLGGILADDMGLGKTVEVISMLSTINNTKPILIVCPTSLVLNWKSEFDKFLPSRNVKIISGPSNIRYEEINKISNTDIVIASYESVRIDIDVFSSYDYEIIIADEAQYMKNPQAYKTMAMKRLKADSCFALTGTPIENNVVDLWSIFDFVLPGYLPSKKDFLGMYSNSNVDLANLAKQISPFILRREKQDVLILPPKIENKVYAYLEGKQLKAYEAYLYDVQTKLKEENYALPYVLKTLIRLREFMCEPRLFIENYDGPNAKLDTLMEIINESIMDEHRILLFSSFPSVFKYITQRLEKENIVYDILDGKTPKEERLEKVNRFNEDSKIKVFLISLKVGGSGLNLTGADMVIHYDPWWNAAATNQATDRAYRFGQTKEVHVVKLIVKDTIEEKILQLQKQKTELYDNVINESSLIKHLTKDEIIDLFGGKR